MRAVTSRVSATFAVSSREWTHACPRVQCPSPGGSGHQASHPHRAGDRCPLANLGLVGVGDEHIGVRSRTRSGAAAGCRRPPGRLHRFTHMCTRRWFIAIIQAHPGTDVDGAVGKIRDLTGPRTRSVDDNSGVNAEFLATALVADMRARPPVTVDLEVEHAMVG